MIFTFSTFYYFVILPSLIFFCTSPPLVWTFQSWLIHIGVVGAAIIAPLWCKWHNSFTITPICIYFKAPGKKPLGEPVSCSLCSAFQQNGKSRAKLNYLVTGRSKQTVWCKTRGSALGPPAQGSADFSLVYLSALPAKIWVLRMLPALLLAVQNPCPISKLCCRLQSSLPS